jgi:peptidoglycan/LPS O-acetylase OafA/YrhL
MKRVIAALIAAFTTANGLIMLLDGQHWYGAVPGVPETGPYNGHFIQDIGIAFLVAGLALAATAWRPRYWPAGAAAAAFLGGHALLHLAGMLGGHDHHTGFDLLAIVVPAALTVYSIIPTQKETFHA